MFEDFPINDVISRINYETLRYGLSVYLDNLTRFIGNVPLSVFYTFFETFFELFLYKQSKQRKKHNCNEIFLTFKWLLSI